jgi:enoyl-CoA hydratase/carnithine racemase
MSVLELETVRCSSDNGVGTITLNRPDALNAWTRRLGDDMLAALEHHADDPDVRVIVFTGAGRAFSSGADLKAGGELTSPDGGFDVLTPLRESYNPLILRVRTVDKPVIAAVNGPAAGFGLALALGSDIRFASTAAVFRVAFINIGVSNCDMGTSWLLPRLIGASRAHELMLTGRRVDAAEALRIGLVADVVDPEALLDRALEAAEQIASLAPWGVRLTKKGMWAALEIPSEQAAVEYEDRQQIMSTFGAAPPEAIAAFLEKRSAEFDD